ncbi:F-box domain-containing protein [Haematococcus lacustris]|uniref:F-box domain-containing protein n=1 Tax=Haematococcus lacustris TaxID=44745 RepID=A0A699ZT82_HAELA|nr:F-box domain-containing protein [Haematococcus lacustris]
MPGPAAAAGGNKDLAIARPLATLLTALPRLQVLDARGIHIEPGSCWSEAKCRTMAHLAAGAKLMKRRPYPQKLLMDA